MTSQVRFGEDQDSVLFNFKAAALAGNQRDVCVGESVANFVGQPGRDGFVASHHAILDRNFHRLHCGSGHEVQNRAAAKPSVWPPLYVV